MSLAIFQNHSPLDLALSGSSVHSPVILCPAPGSQELPLPWYQPPAPAQVVLSSPASPTDACLPVGMEHKLDMAAAPGTLLCVIARVLAATVTIVACHCAERAGGLSACFTLGTTVPHNLETGPHAQLPFPCSLFLPPLAAEPLYPSSPSHLLPTAIPVISHLQSRWFLVSSKPGRHSQAIPPLGVSRQM